MARIQFSSETEEILGKLAGSVFQDSYIGFQIRGWSKPRNPQTQLSQLRRGDFRFLSAGWRNLSSIERATWISEAGTVPEALRLYIGNNINLILIGESIISTYVPTGIPDVMPLQITAMIPSQFDVAASSALTIVPAGTKLLLFSTTDKLPTKRFINPSEYEPIAWYASGTDFSSSVSILTEWNDHYGEMRADRRICIKSATIDSSNGNRIDAGPSCATELVNHLFEQPFFETFFE